MSTSPALIRETFPVGPLQCNCTIIGDPLTRKAIVVDPGGDHELILQRLDRLGLQLVSIIHTHAHLDHFLASGEMKKRTGASLHLHKDDQFLWDNLEMQCQLFGVPYTPVPAPDRWLADDEELACGCGVALHTPGHTPGSMSFWFPRAKLLIAGDTLFRRGIGRTDLWGGDPAFDPAAPVQPRRGRHGGRRPWPGHHARRRDAREPLRQGLKRIFPSIGNFATWLCSKISAAPHAGAFQYLEE